MKATKKTPFFFVLFSFLLLIFKVLKFKMKLFLAMEMSGWREADCLGCRNLAY